MAACLSKQAEREIDHWVQRVYRGCPDHQQIGRPEEHCSYRDPNTGGGYSGPCTITCCPKNTPEV